ncbi:MAG: hypothetical protein WB816_09790 [Methylocystis sp.]
MAQIIPFRSRTREPRQTTPAGEDARILFFMGVRYMRLDDYMATRTDAPGRGDERGGGAKRKRRARA